MTKVIWGLGRIVFSLVFKTWTCEDVVGITNYKGVSPERFLVSPIFTDCLGSGLRHSAKAAACGTEVQLDGTSSASMTRSIY